MDIFVIMGGFCQEKTKPNKPNLFSPQHCWGLKGDLKKQSQFAVGQIGVNSYMRGDYENMLTCGLRKNKANSKPNKANFDCSRSRHLAKEEPSPYR